LSKSVAVVGAGIVGLMAALEASRAGAKVEVYDEARQPGRGASGHNAGVIHVLQPPFLNRKARLARRANRLFDGLAEEAGFSLRRQPALLVYRNKASEKALALAAASLLRMLAYKVKIVGPGVFRDLCPDSEIRPGGAVYVEGYATVNPVEVLEALRGLLESRGVEFHLGVRVDSLRVGPPGEGVEIRSELGERRYTAAVVAAGPDTMRLARSAGLHPPRVGFYKGVMAVARLNCDAIAAEIRSSRRTRKTKGGGVIPWPDGRVILGPTFARVSDPWDTSFTREELVEAAEAYRGILGFTPEVREGLAGTRVKNEEKDDFYTARRGRAVFLGAIDSPGFTASPLLARWAVTTALGDL